MTTIAPETHEILKGIAAGDADAIGAAVEMRAAAQEQSGLDARTFDLVKIAALVALDAPPASYGWQVANAIDHGVTAEEILGILRAVAPQVGMPRVVAAAPEIIVALGLALPDGE